MLLKEIEYFDHSPDFLAEVQYHMTEEFFQKGKDIVVTGDTCDSVMFIVKGLIELQIYD